jgi:hypothetical protein
MAAKKSPQELLAELSAKYSPGGGAVPASPQPSTSTPAAGEPAARARPPIIPPRSRTGTLTAPPPVYSSSITAYHDYAHCMCYIIASTSTKGCSS